MVNASQSRAQVQAPESEPLNAETGLFYRVHTELPWCDPWTVAREMHRPGDACVYWSGDDFEFAALGVVTQRTFGGASRFQDADEWFRQINGRILGPLGEEVIHGLPLVVGGFSFADDMAPEFSDPWLGWRPGMLRLPRVLVYRRGKTCGAVSTHRVRVAQQPTGSAEKLKEEALDALQRAIGRERPTRTSPVEERDAGRLGFESQVQLALDGISNAAGGGSLSKVVLSRRAAYHASEPIDPRFTVDSLRDEHPKCVTFAFEEPTGRHFLGSTPELLARKSGRLVSTRALAGTQRREASGHGAELLASKKDRLEHTFVVQAVVDSLQPLSGMVRHDPEPTLKRLRDVYHLETVIEADLRGSASLLQSVACLHPTPAIGGTPTHEAQAFIGKHETQERGWYTGPIGWIDASGDGEFHVALRCGIVDGQHAWGFAGAGIVRGSTPTGEWEETAVKLRAFHRALGDPQEEG